MGCSSAGGQEIELHIPSQELKLDRIYGSIALWFLGTIGTMVEESLAKIIDTSF